ncbi:hypothetical protein ACFXKJ_41875 [Kitasatospora indigofera]|uniref:hypothetical protein n=1 Tax=Kitasatospora indigofera TaxID=67307 RepID=UPI0036A4F56F
MHHFVTLSGVAAVLLAAWIVQLTMLALHVRYTIRNGLNDAATENSEFSLALGCVLATAVSAIGGGVAFGAGLHATAWGWAQVILAIGATASHLLLTYATGWNARTWWDRRKTRKTGRTTEAVETTA